jgi:glycosyltransferase involved in cell wall biosynthesis
MKKTMRLLLVIPNIDSYRAFLHDLYSELHAAGTEIHVACTMDSLWNRNASSLDLYAHFHPLGLPRGMSPIAHLVAAHKLNALVRRLRPDVVHAHFSAAIFTTALAWRNTWPPTLGSFQGLSFPQIRGLKGHLLKSAESWAASRFDTVSVLTPDDLQHLSRTAKRASILQTYSCGFGCDLEKFDPERISTMEQITLRARLGIKPDDRVFVFVGRFVEFKGFDLVVRTFLQIAGSHARLRLLLVGAQDPLHPSGLTQKENRALERCAQIIEVGHDPDVAKYLTISRAMVFPSRREGMPVCLMEALAMGLPVITRDSRGCRDVVRHKRDGLVLKNPTVDTLSAAIKCLAEDDNLHNQLSVEAFTGRQRFDRRTFVREQIELYQEFARPLSGFAKKPCRTCARFAVILLATLLCLISAGLGFARHSVGSFEYGQYYGYPADFSQTGLLVLNPHHRYFSQLPEESIKAPHGHLQHFYPAKDDDDFPYAELQALEAQQVASGGLPIFITATYEGKSRPVYFAWHLGLDSNGHPTTNPSTWGRPVNLRDETFIQFFVKNYVHEHMFQPPLQNYWLAVDNCSFSISLYGVLDDRGIFHAVDRFDRPFPQNDKDYLDSVIYFLKRLKVIAPQVRIIGNAGSMSDESRFAEVWAGFDGMINEDFLESLQSDGYSRDRVYKAFARCQWAEAADKVVILRALIPNDSSFEDKLRTAYVAYVILRGPNFYFAPRYSDDGAKGIPMSTYSQVQAALGTSSKAASSRVYNTGSRRPGYRLYWRETSNGIAYLNWSGKALTVQLPTGRQYVDRNGETVASITIPDLHGDYVRYSTDSLTRGTL